MKGRKPTPDYIKRLTGNPGKRPLHAAAPALPSERPTPPEFLSPAALAHWHRMILVLERDGKLNPFTPIQLARYCVACADFEEISILEARMGKARFKPRKATWRILVHLRAEKKIAEATMRHFEAEYGLTPTSAPRVASQPSPSPQDGFDAYLASNPQLSDLTPVDPAPQGS
jgi:phage terminase small subunit